MRLIAVDEKEEEEKNERKTKRKTVITRSYEKKNNVDMHTYLVDRMVVLHGLTKETSSASYFICIYRHYQTILSSHLFRCRKKHRSILSLRTYHQSAFFYELISLEKSTTIVK